MTNPLANYLSTLMGDRTLRDVATSGISRSALHQILNGTTTQPTPESLRLLARYFGASDVERGELYATMMALAGYFDPMFPVAYAITARPDFDELAEQWLTALERDADSPAAQDFARHLRTLKKHDPTQFGLYYHAALTLARLRETE